ncbi:MAG: hypothetical protein AB7K71_36855 [Polyangiaceae bacterium]
MLFSIRAHRFRGSSLAFARLLQLLGFKAALALDPLKQPIAVSGRQLERRAPRQEQPRAAVLNPAELKETLEPAVDP